MPKIILITHQKGGVGKSTLTFNMALILNQYKKVAILDLDPQGSLFRSRNGLDVPVLSADNISKIQDLDFDFIFIDTPPYLNERLPELSSIANAIVIPTKTGLYDLLAIEDTIDIIKAAKGEDKSLIVFNMVKPNTTLTDDMLQALGRFPIPVAKTQISDLVAFTRSAYVQDLTQDKARKQMEDLTREVLERMN